MGILLHKRYVICIIIAMLCSFSTLKASSQEVATPRRDSIVRSSSLYFKFDVWEKIDSVDHKEMKEVILWTQEQDDAVINITGWADERGATEYNKRLSERRAFTAAKYLIECGLDSTRITYQGMGVDYSSSHSAARRSTISATKYFELAPPAEAKVEEKPQPKPAVEPEPQVVEQYIEPTPEPEPALSEESAPIEELTQDELDRESSFSLRTNLLYWLACSMNIGFEWNPANTHLGVLVNGGYAPLGGDHWEHSCGGWFISPELRYYLGREDHWFVGAQFLAGGYNFKLSESGYQGDVIAGGIVGGYKIELSEIFDMDFTLGVGYGSLEYDTYYHYESGINVLIDKGVKKSSLMPIQTGVSLIWKIK